MGKLSFLFRLMTLICFLSTSALWGQSPITLFVDATDAPRKILHARETIAVHPGTVTLMYPEWIPGEHGPTGPVTDLAGLKIRTADQAIPWQRDLVDMYAIHVNVPKGRNEIELTFDFLLPPQAVGFSSGASSSTSLLILSWNQIVLYPREPKPDKIMVTASLRLPAGWKFGTALSVDHQAENTVSFSPVSLTQLVDSPVLAALYFRRVDISPADGPPIYLDIASDGEATLKMTEDQVAIHKQLGLEANALFGAHHYDHYDFLYTLSDQVAHFGLEHHQSSDDRVDERTLLDDNLRRRHASLLSHEFVHSWNGKYRRPLGLTTGDFTTPMKDDLLWVYEGLTQYLGNILASRSGLRSTEDYYDNLAMVAARLDNQPGRTWRPLQDCANEAQLLYNARGDWSSWRREVDFYDEGDLIWLEADVTIRQHTGGKKSLDDFCKSLFGGKNTGPTVKPYTFDDVVVTMNDVTPYNWKKFFVDRLESLEPRAPLGGIESGGWKLVYRDTMSSFQKADQLARKIVDVNYSLGFSVDENGQLIDVLPGTPSAKAGLAPGMKLVAINGRRYTKEILRTAIGESKNSSSPIELLTENGDFYTTYAVDYHGGERYPHLERDSSRPDIVTAVINPIAKRGSK